MDVKMESFVNCPVCNELVRVAMVPYTGFMDEITSMIEQAAGIDKTNHFEGRGKCKCGRWIQATIHVTALPEGTDGIA